MTDWWEQAFKRRESERSSTMALLRITVYGSFNPPNQKKQLESLCVYLNGKGFTDTDIIGGNKRPHFKAYDSYQISTFYLEESDVNFLVYTREGARLGLTTECDHLLNSEAMSKRWDSCVIFNQTEPSGKDSIGQLQKDRLLEINSTRNHISIVPFEKFSELNEAAYNNAVDFHKAMGPILRQRL